MSVNTPIQCLSGTLNRVEPRYSHSVVNGSAAKPYDRLEKLAPFNESIHLSMYLHTHDAKFIIAMPYSVKFCRTFGHIVARHKSVTGIMARQWTLAETNWEQYRTETNERQAEHARSTTQKASQCSVRTGRGRTTKAQVP
jgi:hypothetical protein